MTHTKFQVCYGLCIDINYYDAYACLELIHECVINYWSNYPDFKDSSPQDSIDRIKKDIFNIIDEYNIRLGDL